MPMSPDEVEAFLAAPRLCHFATVDEDGLPRVRPLWYLWRDGAFWFTTRLRIRRTGRDLVAGSPATLSIASEDEPYRAVVAHGRVEILGKDRQLLRDISTRYGDSGAWADRVMGQEDRTCLRLSPDWLLSWHYGRDDSAAQDRGVSMRTDV